jgi:hypothetical protein
MHFRTLAFAAALSAAPLLAGCGPAWIVHSQAAPDPFLGQKSFAVLPIDYAGLQVGAKSEQDYLSGKTPDQQESFRNDKEALNGEFLHTLQEHSEQLGIQVVPATGPQSAPFLIKPSVQWIEPGYNVVVSSHPSEVQMVVRITTPDGKVLDEVGMRSKSTDYASGSRLRTDGAHLGKIMAAYLQSRVAPGA